MQILGLVWANAHRPLRETRTRELLALQRADGGWPQTPYLASDAWFRQRLRIGRPGLRALAAIPAVATIALGVWMAAAQVAALVVVIAVLFTVESRRGADPPL